MTYEGGWQNNRRMGMHDKYRFVENIFEELDAPGEWFLDAKTSTLYFYPPQGLDLATATVEVVRLRHLVEFRGDRTTPSVRHAQGLHLPPRRPHLHGQQGAAAAQRLDHLPRRRDLLQRHGRLLAWRTAVIDQVGGNAIFVNNYNRRVTIRGCHICRRRRQRRCLRRRPRGRAQPAVRIQPSVRASRISTARPARRPTTIPPIAWSRTA